MDSPEALEKYTIPALIVVKHERIIVTTLEHFGFPTRVQSLSDRGSVRTTLRRTRESPRPQRAPPVNASTDGSHSAAVMAGPGQMPPVPQPKSKSVAPRTSRASMGFATGSANRSARSRPSRSRRKIACTPASGIRWRRTPNRHPVCGATRTCSQASLTKLGTDASRVRGLI